jgi:hypothetical protein
LAKREFAKTRRNKSYRSDVKTLRRLASCDMHLTLPGARQSDLFDERWFETSSMLATKILAAAGGILAAAGGRTRKAAANRVAERLAKDIGIRSFDGGQRRNEVHSSALHQSPRPRIPGTGPGMTNVPCVNYCAQRVATTKQDTHGSLVSMKRCSRRYAMRAAALNLNKTTE